MEDMCTKLFHISTQISWLDVLYIPSVPESMSQMDIKNCDSSITLSSVPTYLSIV